MIDVSKVQNLKDKDEEAKISCLESDLKRIIDRSRIIEGIFNLPLMKIFSKVFKKFFFLFERVLVLVWRKPSENCSFYWSHCFCRLCVKRTSEIFVERIEIKM